MKMIGMRPRMTGRTIVTALFLSLAILLVALVAPASAADSYYSRGFTTNHGGSAHTLVTVDNYSKRFGIKVCVTKENVAQQLLASQVEVRAPGYSWMVQRAWKWELATQNLLHQNGRQICWEGGSYPMGRGVEVRVSYAWWRSWENRSSTGTEIVVSGL